MALVPAKILADNRQDPGPTGGEVTVALARGGLGEGMIGFVGGARRTTSRLLDGDFPKVRNLLPDHHSAQPRSRSRRCRGGPRVALGPSAPPRSGCRQRRTGWSSRPVAPKTRGPARRWSALRRRRDAGRVQPRVLLDGLAALDGPMAVLSMTDPAQAGRTRAGDADGEIILGYRYLIMPIRSGPDAAGIPTYPGGERTSKAREKTMQLGLIGLVGWVATSGAAAPAPAMRSSGRPEPGGHRRVRARRPGRAAGRPRA